MSIRSPYLFLACTVLAWPTAAHADGSEAELDRGIALVQEGEYAEAIIVLDAAARRLAKDPGQQLEAAQAYLHLGIAYVGEGQEALAKASFREAAACDADLVLTAFDVSPKVRELFQQARDELARDAAAASPGAPEKKGGSKLPLILIGVGGAAAAGVAVAGSSGGEDGGSNGGLSSDSSVQIVLQQEETPLVGLEVVFSFTSNNVNTYETSWLWDFGDGNTSNANGEARHTYSSPGSYTVTLTVTAGRSISDRLDVEVRSLTGVWDGQDSRSGEGFVVQMTQSGTSLSGTVDGTTFTGDVSPGRVVSLFAPCPRGDASFQGSLSSDATRITGQGSLPCRDAAVGEQTLTLRQ
jgi:hypothetical protein